MIARSRLSAVVATSRTRLVQLIAPAGYGKTTLVAQAFPDRSNAATVDLERVQSVGDIMRRVLLATAPFQSAAQQSDLSQSMMGLGDDAGAWSSLAALFLAAAPAAFVLHLENCEALANVPGGSAAIETMIAHLPDDARVVVCSRVDIFDRNGVLSTTTLTAHDLRLTRSEIRDVTAGLAVTASEIDAIDQFTRGWPIVVMMLVSLARRSPLRTYLRPSDDVADLYTYLASEVYGELPPHLHHVLDAITAVPDIRASELALLLPDQDIPENLERLRTETPFIGGGERFAVHPAMREMIANAIDIDIYRAQLFERVDRADGGIRAAEIALLRDRPADAARVLSESGTAGTFLSASQAEIFGRLPESVFVDFPQLWIGSLFLRSAHDVVETLQITLRLLARLPASTPIQTRIDLLCSAAQLFANRGNLTGALDIAEQLISGPAFAGNVMAHKLGSFMKTVVAFYRGDLVDIAAVEASFGDILDSSPLQRSFYECIAYAAQYRAHGDRAADGAAADRGLALARDVGAPLIVAIATAYGAMSAWFWGDGVRYEQHIAALEATVRPSFANMFNHMVDCARGRADTATFGSEKLDMRAYACAFAATNTHDPNRRIRYGEAALLAAQQSSQRFSEIIARVILACCQPAERSEHLTRARSLATEMQSGALIAALDALAAGDASGTMLASLAAA